MENKAWFSENAMGKAGVHATAPLLFGFCLPQRCMHDAVGLGRMLPKG